MESLESKFGYLGTGYVSPRADLLYWRSREADLVFGEQQCHVLLHSAFLWTACRAAHYALDVLYLKESVVAYGLKTSLLSSVMAAASLSGLWVSLGRYLFRHWVCCKNHGLPNKAKDPESQLLFLSFQLATGYGKAFLVSLS